MLHRRALLHEALDRRQYLTVDLSVQDVQAGKQEAHSKA